MDNNVVKASFAEMAQDFFRGTDIRGKQIACEDRVENYNLYRVKIHDTSNPEYPIGTIYYILATSPYALLNWIKSVAEESKQGTLIKASILTKDENPSMDITEDSTAYALVNAETLDDEDKIGLMPLWSLAKYALLRLELTEKVKRDIFIIYED